MRGGELDSREEGCLGWVCSPVSSAVSASSICGEICPVSWGRCSWCGLPLPLKNEQSRALCWCPRALQTVLCRTLSEPVCTQAFQRERVGCTGCLHMYQLRIMQGDLWSP